ncbi:hypothetical protein ACWOBE_08470 [Hutsoniella sourekii]
MKSSVTNYIDYRNIPVPKDKLTIEIPSWEQVARPMVDRVQLAYQDQTGQTIDQLEDSHVQALNIPDLNTVGQVKSYGMEVFQKRARIEHYYQVLLPYILNHYYINSNAIMNTQEKDAYIQEYLEQVQAYADQEGLTLKQYGQSRLNIQGDVKEALEQRALEDFNFKLIANDIYAKNHGPLDHNAYEEYINQQVLYQQVDEIELRDQFSYQQFINGYPEMWLADQIRDYYLPQIQFKINPDLESIIKN